MTERSQGRERGPWLAFLQLDADLPQEGGSTGESPLPTSEKLQRITKPDDVVPFQLLHCWPTLRGLAARPVASRICNPSCRQMIPTSRRCGSISCRALSVRWSAGPLLHFRSPSLCLISSSPLPADLARRRAPEGQLAQGPPASLHRRSRFNGRPVRVDRGSVQATLRARPALRHVLTFSSVFLRLLT